MATRTEDGFDAYWRGRNLPMPDETDRGRRYAPFYDAARRAWEHQQRRIDELEAAVKRLIQRDSRPRWEDRDHPDWSA